MNTDWLDGKHPVIREALKEARQTVGETADQAVTSDGVADWLSGWGVYWFIVILLACAIGGEVLIVAFFIALIKWFGQGRKKDRQNRTDKLYHKIKKGDSPSIFDDYDNDTIMNPIHNIYLGNIAHEDDHWQDDHRH
jgi:hypothetical protein